MDQTEIIGSSGVTAIFIEYHGYHRCAKCIFQSNEKKCEKAPCTPEERKDGRRGFFRAANAKGNPYKVSYEFVHLIK